jgi:hypothetical protein
MYLNMCSLNTSHTRDVTKCISTYVDQTYPMPEKTQNVSKHVLTKPLTCQRGHEMYLNMFCPNPSHTRGDKICFSTCVVQTPPMNARTENASQYVLTKPFARHEDPKGISTCVDQTDPMPARTQNESQHVLNKPLP